MDTDYYYPGPTGKFTSQQQHEKKTMQIQIITTAVETKPTKTGKTYEMLEVVFKNVTFQGKVESKKLMSFGANANAFSTLSSAAAGTLWEVGVTKNDAGYNDWTSVVTSNGAVAASTAGAPPIPGKATIGAKSTYETPEERAQRQILIVRQSSLSAAVATLSVGAKALKPADVMAVAQQYSDFVFGVKDAGDTGFDDLPSFDVPEVD